MKKIITTLFAASVLLFACNNSTKENSKGEAESTAQEEVEHQHGNESEDLTLNNGEKWEADENTKTCVKNMQNDVNAFETKGTTDYAELDTKIKGNIKLLTSGCTMKGQAHDELHKWLLPFIGLAEEFSASKTEQEFTAHMQDIKTSLAGFNTYFK